MILSGRNSPVLFMALFNMDGSPMSFKVEILHYGRSSHVVLRSYVTIGTVWLHRKHAHSRKTTQGGISRGEIPRLC